MRQKLLSDEDRVLWNQVARTARPLKARSPLTDPQPPEAAVNAEAPRPPAPPAVAAAVPKKHASIRPLDQPTLEKLAKGRLQIEGRVDLHGMTQEQAYSLLYSFLHRAHANGVRYVLIITGKGSSAGGDGVLRRAVPGWLATPSFRTVVSSHDHAARNHGGSGALYVRLRRTR